MSRIRYLSVAAACAIVACLGATGADAAKKPKAPVPKLIVLGASSQTVAPACPADPCQAIGKVTGFQTSIGGTKKPFVAPFDGRVVAWSIKLSAPTEKQSDFFTDFYGGPPKARLAVLKPRKGKKKKAYTLRAQTPVEPLSGLLGATTTFTLGSPLPVRRGQVVALTVPTWAPAFAIGLPPGNNWLASRKARKCNTAAEIKAGSAHDKQGQRRTYGCTYNTARLLYSATMVRGALPRK